MQKSVKLAQISPDPFFYLGLVEMESKRWKSALAAFQSATKIEPKAIPYAWFYLGESAYKARKWVTAKRAFKKFLKLEPRGEMATDARKRLRALRY